MTTFGIAFYRSNLAGEEEQLEPVANSAEQPGLDLPGLLLLSFSLILTGEEELREPIANSAEQPGLDLPGLLLLSISLIFLHLQERKNSLSQLRTARSSLDLTSLGCYWFLSV
jgi:hypothetical protein